MKFVRLLVLKHDCFLFYSIVPAAYALPTMDQTSASLSAAHAIYLSFHKILTCQRTEPTQR